MLGTNMSELHSQIAAICPIDGISIGDESDRSTWRIDFRPEATPEQRLAAEELKLTWQPAPPIPQGTLKWEASEVPGAVRLVAEFNGKKSAIVGAVGADSSLAAMYQSPGPIGPQPAGPRREFHVASLANITDIPSPVVDGDTLYVESDGEYRFTHGEWRRLLVGPALGMPGDTDPLYSALFVAIDALSAGGPPVNPKIITAFNELKIVLGG